MEIKDGVYSEFALKYYEKVKFDDVITMIVRRSLLLFVCCYMTIFCVLQNLKYSFQGQQVLQFQFPETDRTTVDFIENQSPRSRRHLSELQNHVSDSFSAAGSLNYSFGTFNLTMCQNPERTIDGKYLHSLQNEEKIGNLLNDCDKFSENHGYLKFPITKEERDFPLAFGIKMHQNPEQVEQLLRTIYRPHNVYCIHVDKKSDNETFSIMSRIGGCFPNVIVILEREKVVYASYSLVRAELKCMEAVMKSETNWKYYINMAGQEFPLRTNLEMVTILKAMRGANDIETYDHPVFLDWRVQSSFSVFGNSLAETGKKGKFRYKIDISKGSAYGLFTKGFVDLLLNDRVAKEVREYFNDTFAPEENVWATLNTLPWAPGGYSMEVRHLLGTFMSRAVIWSGDSPKCHGKFVRGICVFKSGDLAWLVKQPEFFANKFDQTFDQNVLNCLESWYRAKAYEKSVLLDWKYYLKLPHIKYYRDISDFKKSKNYLLTLKRKWIKENKVRKKL